MHSDQASPGPAWQGQFSDGKTAASQVVDIRLTDRGIQIDASGASEALIWPYGALGVAAPVTRKATDVLVTYGHMPGATLFVADAGFAQALAKAAPQITSASYGWRAARPWIAVAAGVALIAVAIHLSDLSPARWVASLMPDTLRKTVGEQVITSMATDRRVCDAPAGRAALDRLVARLEKASGSSKRFDVKVLDWGLINAFAAPGEQIVLTRAIIQSAKGPDEVAGVLAHEMGHGLGLHSEAGIVRVLGLTAAVELMMGGGGGALANIGVLLTQFSYTRSAEREADATAFGILKQAGISPIGLADFFRRVSKLEDKKGASKTPSLLRTHPEPDVRARTAEAQPTYPIQPSMSQDDWKALRDICRKN